MHQKKKWFVLLVWYICFLYSEGFSIVHLTVYTRDHRKGIPVLQDVLYELVTRNRIHVVRYLLLSSCFWFQLS